MRDPLRLWLLGVLDANTELRAVAQIILQHRQIFWRRDAERFAKTAEHQSRQRVANHRLVVYRQELFADDLGEREKTRSRATGEQNGLLHFGFSIVDFRSLSLQRKSSSAHCCQNGCPAVKSIRVF